MAGRSKSSFLIKFYNECPEIFRHLKILQTVTMEKKKYYTLSQGRLLRRFSLKKRKVSIAKNYCSVKNVHGQIDVKRQKLPEEES